jgi:hypothetical protein
LALTIWQFLFDAELQITFEVCPKVVLRIKVRKKKKEKYLIRITKTTNDDFKLFVKLQFEMKTHFNSM